MVAKFNTAYFIDKQELPYTKLKGHIELLKKNIKVHPAYHNDTACAKFIGASADSLKQKTHEKIKDATYLW